jgi:hypothetical protein
MLEHQDAGKGQPAGDDTAPSVAASASSGAGVFRLILIIRQRDARDGLRSFVDETFSGGKGTHIGGE